MNVFHLLLDVFSTTGFQANGRITHADIEFYIPSISTSIWKESDTSIIVLCNRLSKDEGTDKFDWLKVHAPHSGHNNDIHEAFREEMEDALRGQYAHGFLFSDLNPIIEPAQTGGDCYGKYGVRARNEPGDALVN